MNPQQARARVADTFPQAFNRAKFLEFTRNLLNKFDESKAAQWNATYVKDAFKPHVARFERLGTYTSPDDEKLDVLIVHLTNESKLERARTAIRNFVADHLKTRDEKDAALVAFVSPTERQWRFSYVKMEYAAVETESGKVGVETRLTPARRFSYIVGEGESCHTAQSRFLALLQDTENLPALAQIEDAFSVEAVTKEFFNQYAALFGDIEAALQKLAAKDKTIRDEFQKKRVSTVDFAKKLMGQIVFLYFLQKKGWLGVEKGKDWGTGPHDFLRRLAGGEYGAYENFFNDILEPLFYDTLATDRGHEAWCKTFKCRIPFLNGGLFEPPGDYDWRKTDITLPNKFFTNTERNDAGDTGTGVLDVFDRYNFTVNEAEPLEKEVAIDPEMLGKVFENLIEENRRKGLGSFYTPREIVHYMCQESLINYLDTSVNTPKENVPRADLETFVHLGDQISHYEAVDTRYAGREMPKKVKEHAKLIDAKLADITVCDPAVGSGAFPVGMMTEIVRARSALTPYFNDPHDRTPYHFKRHAIQNCLYGVDIDPGAVEIAKLRLWLSLVVDEEDVKQIKPLPNLEFKVLTGNSLYGFPFKSQKLSQIENLKDEFFEETDHDRKGKLKQQIEHKLAECFASSQGVLGYGVNFDFEINFSEVFNNAGGGFDVIIANPPYLGEKGHKEVFRPVAAAPLGRRFYTGKMDLFYFFFHLGLDLAMNRGVVSVISTNYFITATAAKVLRTDFKTRATVKRMVNFNEVRIFESAQGQHNMITFLQKGAVPEHPAKTCITSRTGFVNPDVLTAIASGADPKTEYFEVPQSSLYESDENYIKLRGVGESADNPITSILNKMRQCRQTLGVVVEISTGIQTGADKVSASHLKNHRIDAQLGDGIFVLSEDEVHQLRLPSGERTILKPWFKNSDVARWATASETNQWVIFADKRLRNLRGTRLLNDHLMKFKAVLDDCSSNSPYLHRPRSIKFEGPKIVVPQRAMVNVFGFNCLPWYASVDVYFITDPGAEAKMLKSVLALLNSRLYYFWFYHQGKRKGEALELYQKPLSETPIPELTPATKGRLELTVDRILAAKARDAAADVSGLEREIDQLVYALYGLTPAEIQIVESAAK